MRIIEPYQVTPAMMVASNVPETEYSAWAPGSTYAMGARVVHAHGVWESVQAGNTGHDPTTDANSTWWVRLGATNRWRAFDNRLGGKVVGGATITYSIVLPRSLNAMAFFGLVASSIRVRVTAPGSAVVLDRTIELVNRPLIANFWEYVYSPFEFRPDLILTELLLPSGSTVEITITAGAIAEVAEIILGNDLAIGTTLTDTSLGIVDYSKKERDAWGGIYLVPRPATKTVRFRFCCPTDSAARVQKIIERVTSKLCIFYAVDGEDPFGATVAGILRDYDLTLQTGMSFGSIDAESMA